MHWSSAQSPTTHTCSPTLKTVWRHRSVSMSRTSQLSLHFREQQEHSRLIIASLLMVKWTLIVCLQCGCLSTAPKQLLAFTHWPIFSQFGRNAKTQEEQSCYKFHENQEPAKGEQLWGLWEEQQHKSKSHETWEEAHLSGHPAAGKHSNPAHTLIHCKELNCTTQEIRHPVFHHLWNMFPSFPSPPSPPWDKGPSEARTHSEKAPPESESSEAVARKIHCYHCKALWFTWSHTQTLLLTK